MGIYSGLTEAQLQAKIEELRGKLETLAGGGGVVRVSGEGRMMEFTRGSSDGLRRMLQDALNELAILRGEDPYSAIGVVFP